MQCRQQMLRRASVRREERWQVDVRDHLRDEHGLPRKPTLRRRQLRPALPTDHRHRPLRIAHAHLVRASVASPHLRASRTTAIETTRQELLATTDSVEQDLSHPSLRKPAVKVAARLVLIVSAYYFGSRIINSRAFIWIGAAPISTFAITAIIQPSFQRMSKFELMPGNPPLWPTIRWPRTLSSPNPKA